MNAPHPLPSLCRDNPGERIERSIGADYGADGYIARAQADELADLLELRPGQHLLDIGAGSGWPGPYLAAHRLPRRLGGPSPRPAADATSEPGNGRRTRAEDSSTVALSERTRRRGLAGRG